MSQLFRKNVVVPGGAISQSDLPPPVIGKKFPTYRWANFLVRFPGISGIIMIIPPLIIAFVYIGYTLSLEVDVKGYEIQSHPTYRMQSMTETIQTQWAEELKEFQTTLRSCVQVVERATPTWRIYLVYRSRINWWNNYNLQKKFNELTTQTNMYTLLNPLSLREIRDLESYASRLKNWPAHCWTNTKKLGGTLFDLPVCAPFGSLMTYFFPGEKRILPYCSLTDRASNLRPVSVWDLDGMGLDMTDRFDTLSLIQKNPSYRWFVGKTATLSRNSSKVMRTQVTIGTPLPKYKIGEKINQQTNKAKEFVRELYRRILDYKGLQTLDVAIGGSFIPEIELGDAFERDKKLIVISIAIVVLSLSHHSHSAFIGITAMGTMAVSFPCSLLLYRVMTGNTSISLLVVLSFYIMVSLTSDSMYIFFSSFRQSGIIPTHGRVNMLNLPQRLAWVYRKAGIAIIISSLIVLVSIATNIMIPIPAFSNFSKLITIMTVVNAYMFLFVFPCLVIFHHVHISRRRRNAQRLKDLLIRKRGDMSRRHIRVASLCKELFPLSHFTQRPHKTVDEDGIPLQQTKVVESDFRKSKRKQPKEYIIHVPRNLAYGNDEANMIVLAAVESIRATSHKVKSNNLPSGLVEDKYKIADWNTLEWPQRHRLWKELAELLNVTSQNAHISQVSEVIDDKARGTITGPVFNKARGSTPVNNTSYLAPPHSASRQYSVNSAAISSQMTSLFMSSQHSMLLTPRSGYTKNDIRSKIKIAFMGTTFYRWLRKMKGERETESEKEARILQQSIKKEGYTPMERMFYNKLAPIVYKCRYILSVIGIALLVGLMVVAISSIKPSKGTIHILRDDSNYELYKDWTTNLLDGESSCDYCSAYYQPDTNFPSGCQDSDRSHRMFSSEDSCGICGGNDECVGCDGKRGSRLKYDKCNVCGGNDLCRGCDGIVNSGLYYDSCMQCGGTDSPPCAGHRDCSNRGAMIGESCMCWGQWGGKNCSQCLCRNKGICTLKGGCVCPFGNIWSGPTCDTCLCAPRGYCQADGVCKCKGMWTGRLCDICSCPYGQYCDESGRCKNCVWDDCNKCNGNNDCLARNNREPRISRSSNATVSFYWGLKGTSDSKYVLLNGIHNLVELDNTFNLSDPLAQDYLLQVCKMMLSKPEVLPSPTSTCIMIQWQIWLQDKGMVFPYPDPETFIIEFNKFISTLSLWNYVGLSALSTKPTTGIRVEWIKFSFVTNIRNSIDSEAAVRRYNLWENLMSYLNERAPMSVKNGIQTSPLWVKAFTQVVATNSALFSLGIAAIVGATLLLAFSSSKVLTLVTVLSVGANLSTILSLFCAMGWSIGPVESTAITCLIGMSASMAVHALEGYIEFVHGHQSHLLAAEATRFDCVRGLLLRTGVPLASSSLTTIAASIPLVFASLEVLRRIGVILTLNSLFSLIYTLLFSTAMLCIIGPVEIIRTRKSFLIYFVTSLFTFGVILLILYLSKAPIRYPTGTLIFANEKDKL